MVSMDIISEPTQPIPLHPTPLSLISGQKMSHHKNNSACRCLEIPAMALTSSEQANWTQKWFCWTKQRLDISEILQTLLRPCPSPSPSNKHPPLHWKMPVDSQTAVSTSFFFIAAYVIFMGLYSKAVPSPPIFYYDNELVFFFTSGGVFWMQYHVFFSDHIFFPLFYIGGWVYLNSALALPSWELHCRNVNTFLMVIWGEKKVVHFLFKGKLCPLEKLCSWTKLGLQTFPLQGSYREALWSQQAILGQVIHCYSHFRVRVTVNTVHEPSSAVYLMGYQALPYVQLQTISVSPLILLRYCFFQWVCHEFCFQLNASLDQINDLILQLTKLMGLVQLLRSRWCIIHPIA